MAFDKAKELERRIAWHMSQCVHFTGIQHATCKADVNYRTLVGGDDVGWAARLPCTELDNPKAVACDQCRRHTREEAEADVKRSDESFARISACLKAIREKHGKARGLRGEMPCPNNCGGTLRYSIAGYNGHVHGACSTSGCASWMQ